MKRRFILANVTAAIPLIAFTLITIFVFLGNATDTIIGVCLAVCSFTGVFCLWYPTLTRKTAFIWWTVFIQYCENGFLQTIMIIIMLVLGIPTLILAMLISPINYPFALVRRIRRMKDGSALDDPIYFKN